MQFTTIVITMAAAISSFASAQENSGQKCDVHQVQACCKTDSDGVLGGLLGGACELNILGQNCANQIACCQVDASGSLLGGSCAPLIQL